MLNVFDVVLILVNLTRDPIASVKKRLSDTNLNAEAGPRSLEGSQTERPMASSTESTIAVRGENSNASSVRNSSESTTSSKVRPLVVFSVNAI